MTGARLLIVNNLPASYRTPLFKRLCEDWMDRTGGEALVMYQARRDPRRRDEWFFSRDADIAYPHVFVSEEARYVGPVTAYTPKFGIRDIHRFAPTHLLVAGWDTPVSLAAHLYARRHGARLVLWNESNLSTSRRNGQLAGGYKRLALRSATAGVIVPTTGALDLVRFLMGEVPRHRVLPNPVDIPRLQGGSDATTSRMLFVGDLSLRKGFDTFMRACGFGANAGWTGAAWGRPDPDLDIAPVPNCEVNPGRPFEEVARELHPGDVWVIPSRSDPAPLTYSEALALGLRIVLSDSVAYASTAEPGCGIEVFEAGSARSLLAAANRVLDQERPTVAASTSVTVGYWSRHALDLLL